MARRIGVEDDWEDEDGFDSDEEEPLDSSDDDEDDTVPCPYCRRPIYEGAERCPFCESYISEEDKPLQPRPWWFVIGFLLCMAIVFMWILSGW